jgi:hypothetical protein
MAQYLVIREPHFLDGMLHPVGSTVTYAKGLSNEKEWAHLLQRLPDPAPDKPVTPQEEAASAKAVVDQLLAQLKEAQARKAEADKKVPQK